MSLRTALLPVVDTIRGLGDPGKLDIRRYAVEIRTRVWSGGSVQLGTPTVADLSISPRPKVTQDGRYRIASGITPAYSGGGYTPEQLNPSDATGTEFYYRLTDPNGDTRPYALVEIATARPFTYSLRLLAIDLAVPF